jgi:CRP-like cAMP-binding protein
MVLRDAGVIGEMGVLNQVPRSATARTLTTTRVLSIRCEDFYRALEDGNLAAHRLAFGFARVLSHRLNTVNDKLFELYESDRDNDAVRRLVDSHGHVLPEL